MSKSETELRNALLATGVVQPHQSYVKGGRLEVLCRHVAGQDRQLMTMVEALLKSAAETEVVVHVCKRFVIKEGRLVFGWNFAVEAKSSKELLAAVGKLKEALEPIQQMAPPSRPVYRTDAQAMESMGLTKRRKPNQRANGITVDAEAGRMGRLAPAGSRTAYRLGKLAGHRISLVEKKDEGGIPTLTFEMPLPHVTRELNVPNEKGRGASSMFRAVVGADAFRNRR